MSTLYTKMSDNIGQVREEDADAEIQHLNKQQNTTLWRKDYSDEMYVEDETDDYISNPCPRFEGYVWITRTS